MKRIIIGLIIVFLIIFIFMTQQNRPQEPEQMITNNTVDLESTRQILFASFNESDFTCTGMTYDDENNSIWIADYGSEEKHPRLVEVNASFDKVLRVIDLQSLDSTTFNLQGISYDKKNDSLWIASGENVYEVSKNGNVVSNFSMGKYSKYKSNGIAVDGDDIWVLCYEKYLLKFDREWNNVGRYDFNYKDQDQICIDGHYIYCTVGADYNGTNNFVFKFDINTCEIVNQYRLLDSYSVEGIIINNDKMNIVNDGKFHEDVVNRSYICEYDIN